MMGIVYRSVRRVTGARVVFLVGLAVVLGSVFAGSTVLFSIRQSGSVAPAYDGGSFFLARLVISSFDPMSGTATGWAEIWVDEGEALWGTTLAAIDVRTQREVGGADEAIYPLTRTVGAPQFAEREPGSGSFIRSSMYEARGVEVTLEGDPRRFPFDEYATDVEIAALESLPAETDFVNPTLYPRFVQIDSEVRDISIAVSHSEFGVSLTAWRPSYDRVVFILASILFAALMYAGLTSAFTQIAIEQPLVLMFGVVGVALALPAVRDLIVPDSIKTGTLFDGLVVIPFLGASLLMLVIVTFRAWKSLRQAGEYD